MLDERKAAILRAVVEEYIETAQPVGSSHVAHISAVEVSPATIRNEMAVLEREGYLVQPHTSAGRIPTDKGYRFFVDQLLPDHGVLNDDKAAQVRDFFDTTHGELERMLHDTTTFLSHLTAYAAVVVGPPHEVATVRSAQLVSLSSRVAMAVVVLSNGAIEKRVVEFEEDISSDVLSDASSMFGSQVVGTSRADLGKSGAQGNDSEAAKLVARTVQSFATSDDESSSELYVGGVSHMASAFDAVDTVRQVLATLEQQYVVVSLLRDVVDRGLSVAIGAEHGFEPLRSCSVVVAPYLVDGSPVGSVGVLGPTRMNYPEAMAAVTSVSDRLGKRLTEG
jgi:heat-inducible transcriptional repressor